MLNFICRVALVIVSVLLFLNGPDSTETHCDLRSFATEEEAVVYIYNRLKAEVNKADAKLRASTRELTNFYYDNNNLLRGVR